MSAGESCSSGLMSPTTAPGSSRGVAVTTSSDTVSALLAAATGAAAGWAAAAEVQHGLVRARAGDQSGAWRVLCRIDPGRLPPADRMRLHINRGTLASELHRFDDAAAAQEPEAFKALVEQARAAL